ncbi:MAG: ATP-binding protein [candidate division KSB1 bacterium]|nr:ATP-binding protein [candidate division KSB1 bacterium]
MAERATKDHVGRWLFELLQNSDDAKASEVRIIVDKDTIYVADNGHGLKPEAVSAICGTDFSDKTAGTIGRKGVGFKSVYEVSQNPQVLTVDGEGIEFSHERTKTWLRENGLNDGHVPYQWIPFFIPWDDAKARDPHLDDLKAGSMKTVVRLPGLSQETRLKVEQLLKEWPPHALFAFRHLRHITAHGLDIVLIAGDAVWSLQDSRGQTPVQWRVTKHTERPPVDLLEMLGADERQAISTDGVSFLIAAPLENDCVVPTSDYLPVHVFYPTEQNGPVRLLLHAEFLVKSDRTALIPIEGSRFNAWVADRLAYYVCKFVNDSFRADAPSSHAALLVALAERASHHVAEALWRRIADKAKKCLRLSDMESSQRLRLEDARLISVSVRRDLARTLLEATDVRGQLLHQAFDDDKEAQKALKDLGCKEIHDQDLMAAILQNADSLAAETQWVWACWEWLAAWVAKEPYGEEHKKRIERVRGLPIVPVNGSLVKPSDLEGRIVTWQADTGVKCLPDWLPLTFVEDWFRDRIQNIAEQESPVKKLIKELGIAEPDGDVVQRAVGQAIEQYWKDKQGDPGRFLRFILEQDWHETADASPSLRRCPVPLAQPVQGKTWAEAEKAYFGREWGNDLLADLYEGCDSVAWVQRMGEDGERERSILTWLGCAAYPRIVEDRGPNKNGIDEYHLPNECDAWRSQEFRHTERTPTVDAISRFETLTLEGLSTTQVCALLVLLAKHWEEYYKGHSEATLSWFYYTTRLCSVRAFWWFQILHNIHPPTRSSSAPSALADCWLPDKRTERVIGDLLHVVDLDAFGNDKDAVRNWLINAVGLRTRMEQLTIDEWEALLSRHIPEKAPTDRLVSEERLRDKVTGWYTACLETMAEKENVPEKAFASCPLLCRKGDVWQYVAGDPRYLDDDNDLAKAFAEDVWLFHIPARLASEAVKYLDVRPLSQSVKVNVTLGKPQSPLSDELNRRFSGSLPYVWAWRSSQIKREAADSLFARLKALKAVVLPALRAGLTLGGVNREVVKRWHVDDDTIYLHKDHANESELAQALAKLLDIRSEADFYENLLRCTNDSQRKEKLLSKGMADAEIDRCLREYSGQSADDKQEAGPKRPPIEEEKPDKSHPPLAGDGLGQFSEQRQLQDNTSEETPKSSDTQKQSLRLKDPKTVVYVQGSSPLGEGHIGGGGGGGTEHEDRSLADAEKEELEEAGRTIAARELERIGYVVENMPQGNPGFDLRAKKNGDELHVEVKAHSGRATVVELTQREYKEYLGQQGYRWELWNVEHLAEDDSHSVSITRYDQIPDDALTARTCRVDLRKCKGTSQD